MATSAKEANHRSSPQNLLTQLHRLYGSRPIRRDPFGRRKALASEIAQMLARGAESPEQQAEEWSDEHPVN
jgi:hypothetical protein